VSRIIGQARASIDARSTVSVSEVATAISAVGGFLDRLADELHCNRERAACRIRRRAQPKLTPREKLKSPTP
jgi:hypothetical protein